MCLYQAKKQRGHVMCLYQAKKQRGHVMCLYQAKKQRGHVYMLGVLILPLFYDFLIGLWNCSDSVVFLFYYYTHNLYIYCRKSFKFLECESSL